jgi:glutamine amidotransferase
MITIIDYQVVNLRSIQKAFERLGHAVEVTADPRRIARASHVVLPGVGAFRAGMDHLGGLGLVPVVRDVIASGTPFLGICLGMQLLMTESEEFGRHPGLGVIPGRVVRFPSDDPAMAGLKVPHMGWNTVAIRRPVPALAGLPDHGYFYFVHSLRGARRPGGGGGRDDLRRGGSRRCWRGGTIACQFHPEKSQALGRALLERFAATVAVGAAS